MPTDQQLIRDWLKQLGELCSVGLSPEEAAAKLEIFAPALATRFDAGAFTGVSLEEVAANCRFFPTYGELVALLRAWLDGDTDQSQPRRIAADADPVTGERDAWVTNWQNHADGNWGRSKDGTPYRGDGSQLKRDLARVKQFQPSAYQRLIAVDPRAMRIARQAGWIRPGETAPLRAAATTTPPTVVRGPIIEDAP